MEDKIIYYIESVERVRRGKQEIAVVTGWTKTQDGNFVGIQIDAVKNWLQCRFLREDVLQGNRENRCGFQLYVYLKSGVKKVPLIFFGGNTKKKATVKIPSEDSTAEGTTGAEEHKIPFLSQSVRPEFHYLIETLYYNSSLRRLRISGWVYAKNGNASVIINDRDSLKWEKRRDVVEALGKEAIRNENCGFTGTVFLPDKEDACKICIDAGEDGLAVLQYEKHLLEEQMSAVSTGNYEVNADVVKWKEQDLNHLEYQWKETVIPDQAAAHWKKKPFISILCAVRLTDHNRNAVEQMLQSLQNQKYRNFELLACGNADEEKWIRERFPQVKYISCESGDEEECLEKAFEHARGEWICPTEQEDLFSACFLSAFVEKLNENKKARVIFQDYDIWYQGEPQVKVQRTERFWKDENPEMAFVAVFLRRDRENSLKEIKENLENTKETEIVHEKRVFYHYHAIQGAFQRAGTDIVAFYLPQYHITEENNKWWGEGFTEWRNVKRGVPMYEGHNQPRVPADLGYYDLVEDRSIQYKQIELAKKFNIYGFCYYYYWFEGKRLLHKPLDQVMENPELDLPFCICWANETWSKRWNGQENEILIRQVHNESTDIAFIKDAIPMFRDKRYIRVERKPLLLVYRIQLFSEPQKTIQRWKKICMEEGIGDIHVSMVQSFGVIDPGLYGADSAVEFPPHKFTGWQIEDKKLKRSDKFSGSIYSYREIVDHLAVIQKRDYSMMTGSMLEWDNTARRMDKADIFAEFTPQLYRKWMIRNHYYTKLYNKSGITFVNAWNEWAEGTYLEPDEKYGTTFLEISKEVSGYK